MCRAMIGIEFDVVDHDIEGPMKIPNPTDGHYWFYEGFRGWWMFDADTCHELEALHGSDLSPKVMEKFIAGHVYIIDLTSMTQRRRGTDGGRVRQILRSKLDSINLLGLAGIKGQDIVDTIRSREEFQVSAMHTTTSHQLN